MLYGTKKVVKSSILGKKRKYFCPKIELKPCFNKNVFSQIILSQENCEERDEKLHYIPNNLNQTKLVLPWTYRKLKCMISQIQESNSQNINTVWYSLLHPVLSELYKLENHLSVTLIKN